MILTVNVSNSNILAGVYDRGERRLCSCIHTNLQKSADEYAVQFHSMLSLYSLRAEDITGVILSCVVPSMLACIRTALTHIYKGKIYIVGPGLKTGLRIRTDDPSQLGSELVCSAVAARSMYPAPCIIISMDTAISFTALDRDGVLCGCAIVPGTRIGMDALCRRTAQLPQIDIAVPACGVLGTSTTTGLQSGAVFGTACLLDGMIDRFSEALGGQPSCIASGDLCSVILPHCRHEIHYHDHLVLDGLYYLYQKNVK